MTTIQSLLKINNEAGISCQMARNLYVTDHRRIIDVPIPAIARTSIGMVTVARRCACQTR
jgi:hypothetical protein